MIPLLHPSALLPASQGCIDAYWQYNLKPWDVAAGAVILEEAGGRLTTADGLAYSVFDRSLIATNDALYEKVGSKFGRTRRPNKIMYVVTHEWAWEAARRSSQASWEEERGVVKGWHSGQACGSQRTLPLHCCRRHCRGACGTARGSCGTRGGNCARRSCVTTRPCNVAAHTYHAPTAPASPPVFQPAQVLALTEPQTSRMLQEGVSLSTWCVPKGYRVRSGAQMDR